MDYSRNRTNSNKVERVQPVPEPGEKEIYMKDDVKESEIGGELTTLDHNLCELSLAVENLEHKITPILSQHVEKDCGEEKTMAGRASDLGSILQGYNSRLSGLTKRIRVLQGRVAL